MMTVDMYYFSLHENYQEKYNHLKQKFIEIASLHINATDLLILKQFYDSVINSKRASDNIKDLLDLIKILEKRLVLSYNNIEPFKYVAFTFVKDPVLNNAIEKYELQLENQQQLPPFNVYKCKSGEYLSQPDQENCFVLKKVNPSKESPKESQLLRSNALHGYSQYSAEILLNRKNSDQIINLPITPNINRHSFMHIFNVNIINSLYFLNSITNDLRYKYFVIRAIMVLVFVIACWILIKITLKPSVSPSVLSISSSTSIKEDSGFTTASQTVSLNSSTTFQPNHQSHQHVSKEPQKCNQLIAFQTEVFQYLSENLGRSWRDLARFLDVKEAEIDSIDLKSHYNYKDRALEALEIFKKRCDSCNWRKKLIKSLEIVRRKDLADHVTDMILQIDNT